jgi:hypothetical protein
MGWVLMGFGGNLQGKRHIGKLRRSWKDDIKMDVKLRMLVVDWMDLVENEGFDSLID